MSDQRTSFPSLRLQIGSRAVEAPSGGSHAHINPATGKVQAHVPLAGRSEIDAAVEAATVAFEKWRRWKPAARRDALLRLGNLLETNGAEFGRLYALEVGMPISFGGRAWERAKEWTVYYAGWADKLGGEVNATFGQEDEFGYVLQEPLGVIGLIATWNGTLGSLGMKASPALAAGNTIVVKPSELTPFTADLYLRLVREAGIPDGVVSMLPGGSEAGNALVENKAVQKISFTGGPGIARAILESCARQLKPAVLELGGKSASLIFPDIDLDAVSRWAAMFSVGLFSGQVCAISSRLLVHAEIYDRFVEQVTAVIRGFKLGDPLDPTVVIGPVINEAAGTRILRMIESAQSEKMGTLVTGGKRSTRVEGGGCYIEPTVFADVDPASAIAQEEIFGPVAVITKFHSEDEAVAIANGTEYGLAAYIHTKDVQRVHRLAERLKVGAVYANGAATIKPNTPFGGIGLSGYGREGGRAGLEEFLRPKTIAIGSLAHAATLRPR